MHDHSQWRLDRRPERNEPGCDLGYTRYDKMAEALGCYAEYVEEPEDGRSALQCAWKKVEGGMVGFVNVKTDYHAPCHDRPLLQPRNLSCLPQLTEGRLCALFYAHRRNNATFSFLAPRRPSRRRHWFAWAGVR